MMGRRAPKHARQLWGGRSSASEGHLRLGPVSHVSSHFMCVLSLRLQNLKAGGGAVVVLKEAAAHRLRLGVLGRRLRLAWTGSGSAVRFFAGLSIKRLCARLRLTTCVLACV
jgi:hypothetical protein